MTAIKEKKKPLARAISKYVRVSPRKARLVAGLIRGKSVQEALLQLTHTTLKSGKLIKKTLISAIANAENGANADRDSLMVSEVRVDEGSFYKRGWARSRGRRSLILRRTSHFYVALDTATNKEKGK